MGASAWGYTLGYRPNCGSGASIKGLPRSRTYWHPSCGFSGCPVTHPDAIVDGMEDDRPTSESERVLALQELRAMGVVSESEYAVNMTGIGTSPAPAEESPEERPGDRMKVSFFRRLLRRE